MLDVNKIFDSKTDSPEFWALRNGRMTSSKISVICDPKGIGEGGLSYIRVKAAERMNNKSYDKDILSEAIAEGNLNEPISRMEFALANKEKYSHAISNKCIVFDDLFSSTPDALLVLSQVRDTINADAWETKCYQVANHMKHCECKTPADIKSINKPLYWQVISQIEFAGVLGGWATFFNPDFAVGSKYRMHSVFFSKKDLRDDFKLLRTRMEEARTIYNNILDL